MQGNPEDWPVGKASGGAGGRGGLQGLCRSWLGKERLEGELGVLGTGTQTGGVGVSAWSWGLCRGETSTPYPAMMAPMLAMAHSAELNPMIPTLWKRSRPSWRRDSL